MNKNRIHSDNMKLVYRADMLSILNEISDGFPVYTNHFEGIFNDGFTHWQFVGKYCRPHLIKCLRTLEADGLIINIVVITNVHKWQITTKGIEALELEPKKKNIFSEYTRT